jgi:hypothetical protein
MNTILSYLAIALVILAVISYVLGVAVSTVSMLIFGGLILFIFLGIFAITQGKS